MGQRRFRLDGLVTSPGMRLGRAPDGTYELSLSAPLGHGTMRGRPLSPSAFAATVDFACHRCPNMVTAPGTGWLSEGTWFTVNLCLEGCCEVEIPGRGLAVVSEGDLCVSHSRDVPAEFRYPSGRYRGIEAFVSAHIAEEPTFSLVGSQARSLCDVARDAGFAAILSNGELDGHMRRLGAALSPFDDVLARYELLGLLLGLQRQDLACAQPRVILTHVQMAIARAAHDEIEGDLARPHDAREIAARLGVSAATLNGYFSRVYGRTVAGYLRDRRMEEAAALLDGGAGAAEAGVQVGYANPSKFAAAFRRAMGLSPRDWKRRLA